jgi:GT2 family glycosyltransferase
MTTAPLVDILIPVHNAIATLEASLQSVADQTFTNFRALVVDDGSTDGSGAALDALAARDPRFVVIHQANGGIVAALNAAIALVEAPFVARMDADDICAPDRLERQLAYLQDHEDCVAVGCMIAHIDEHGERIVGLPQPGDPGTADACWFPAREPYIVHPFLMARTSAVHQVGGYRYVPHSEDSDLYWRLREVGRLHNLPDILGQYRFHIGSISGSSIINGRIMAIGSQLGALAAQRRGDGRLEPDFSKNMVPRLKAAKTLEAMVNLIQPQLRPAEVEGFRLRVAVKILELSEYRPYEVEASDCRFIRKALNGNCDVGPNNALDIRWYVSRAAARLIKAGHWSKGTGLAPVALWPRVLFKSIWR